MTSLPLYNVLLRVRVLLGHQSLSNLLTRRCSECLFCCCCSLSHFFYRLRTCQCNTYNVIPLLFQGQVLVLRFVPTKIWLQNNTICLLETTNVTDHQSCNGLTSDTLNMSQNTAQHSDRNPHFPQCNISAQLICSSVQFIIFILD